TPAEATEVENVTAEPEADLADVMADPVQDEAEPAAPAGSTQAGEPGRKFCPQCGAEVAPDALFCTKCGAQLRRSPRPCPADAGGRGAYRTFCRRECAGCYAAPARLGGPFVPGENLRKIGITTCK